MKLIESMTRLRRHGQDYKRRHYLCLKTAHLAQHGFYRSKNEITGNNFFYGERSESNRLVQLSFIFIFDHFEKVDVDFRLKMSVVWAHLLRTNP